jgi:hypothetical protein
MWGFFSATAQKKLSKACGAPDGRVSKDAR